MKKFKEYLEFILFWNFIPVSFGIIALIRIELFSFGFGLGLIFDIIVLFPYYIIKHSK